MRLCLLSLITSLDNLQSCVVFGEAVKYISFSLCAYLSAVMHNLDKEPVLFGGWKWKHDCGHLVHPDD